MWKSSFQPTMESSCRERQDIGIGLDFENQGSELLLDILVNIIDIAHQFRFLKRVEAAAKSSSFSRFC